MLTDKERILMHIIRGLNTTSVMCRVPPGNYGSDAYRDNNGGHYVHFARWDKPKAGDLVICETSQPNDYWIGFVVQVMSESHCHIREIGTGRICDYQNEKFSPIRGLRPLQLLEGDQYQFYLKVLAAFRKGDKYMYRFGGLEFESNRTAVITIREAFGGFSKLGSQPFQVCLRWTKRTAIKTILASMVAGGYGTRTFEPAEEETR